MVWYGVDSSASTGASAKPTTSIVMKDYDSATGNSTAFIRTIMSDGTVKDTTLDGTTSYSPSGAVIERLSDLKQKIDREEINNSTWTSTEKVTSITVLCKSGTVTISDANNTTTLSVGESDTWSSDNRFSNIISVDATNGYAVIVTTSLP